jgi:3-hydroxybutyryl-CoA dehydrogenase
MANERAVPRFAAVGAGRMGRGIAIAFAYAGHRISLIDLRPRSDEAWRQPARRSEGGDRSQPRRPRATRRDRCSADPAHRRPCGFRECGAAPQALAAAELVFEGVPETMDAKREAFEQISRHCRDDAILTSTTSSILVTQLAALVRLPERFLNMHWLNPAYVIPVVELSCHPGTDAAVLARTKALMEEIGKLPVVCGASPGYIVPRLQALVMNEAARMIEEGAATAEEIDKATRYGLGLRFAALGVVEFIDFGGCDILHHASREMSASIDKGRYTAPAIVDRMVEEGRLGLKSGSGFYDYEGRDIAAYRRDVLSRTLGELKHAGLWRAPAGETLS